MCVMGLYFIFLLLEPLIVGYYSSSFGNTNLTKNDNLSIKDLYNFFNKDSIKSTPPTKHIVKRNIGNQQYPSIATINPNKKREIESITKKQNKVINILKKKNTTAGDETVSNKTTEQIKNKGLPNRNWTRINPLVYLTPPISFQTTTSSKIEFYYLDDIMPSNDKKYTRKDINWQNVKNTTNVPFLIFHLKGPYENRISAINSNNSNIQIQKEGIRISAVRVNKLHGDVEKRKQNIKASKLMMNKKKQNTVHENTKLPHKNLRKEYFFDYNASFKGTTKPSVNSGTSENTNIALNSSSFINESTTIYDKIKFFEIYDQYTPAEYEMIKNPSKVEIGEKKLIDINQTILLEHLDKEQGSHGHIQAKHSKKHITEIFQKANHSMNYASKSKFVIKKATQKKKQTSNDTSYFIDEKQKSEPHNQTYRPYTNEPARWSDYPFTAVYIYEPSQVHCDAAAINIYWLIASGSCLSRVKNSQKSLEMYGEGRSAFVSYCGAQWWDPQRVAYVKYTVVHPSYHHKDKMRQHLYNIGAIQVVNSLMSACSGWAPISLMSHQVAAKPEESWASAVGWGLDRFDTRYGTTDLPKIPLTVYKSIVYFDSCPGNIGYSKTKELDQGNGVRNAYCLALPPYYGEESDPVHGGLLLADGKLIALYLQEERRPWGEQSAQYTGVWRLIPWLMDVAREPEEMDAIIFEV